MYAFKDWPSQHRNLLLIVLFLIIALAVVGYLRTYPRWVEYTEIRDEKASIESKLIKSEWPKDPERLKAILSQLTKRLEKDNGNENGKGLKAETEEVMAKATSMFNERIINEYESIGDFIQKASQTEYKNQYDVLDSYLQGKNINIDSTIFGMDESTAEPLKYQMLLKLWTAKEIVDCALASKMMVMSRRPQAGSRGRMSALITVKPMQSYYINNSDSSPYLLEFPIHIELMGTLENFAKFTDSLFSDGHFLPMSKLELSAVPPQQRNPPKPDKEGNIYSRLIIARVTCSSFFLPQTPPQKEGGSGKGSGGGGKVSERPIGI